MKYSVTYSKHSLRDIKKLDYSVQKRLKTAIERLRTNPLYYSEKLRDFSIGTYRFRVGTYRVIFDIEKDNITILRIGHRREIYKS